MKKIGILLKVFSSEKYRNDFLNGNLYMNTINYFRKYEEEAEGNVGDKYEALTGWMHPKEFKFQFEVNGVKHDLNPEDLAGPVTISMHRHDHANVFCMTHLHSHDIDMSNVKSQEEHDKLKEYFTLPDDVINLGEYMVIITNPKEFISRALAKGEELVMTGEALDYRSKQVTYYDQAEKSLFLEDGLDAPFYKQSLYSHQNEYRLCLNRENPNDEPFKMNIGDLRDLSVEIMTKEFNSLIELRKS
ncbi:hypothetical protein [Pantoea ananatis]|uniref:hypothetical protein n=1 Tax=Pantoea ananas TaxID=553 RepID=UPI0030180B9D